MPPNSSFRFDSFWVNVSPLNPLNPVVLGWNWGSFASVKSAGLLASFHHYHAETFAAIPSWEVLQQNSNLLAGVVVGFPGFLVETGFWNWETFQLHTFKVKKAFEYTFCTTYIYVYIHMRGWCWWVCKILGFNIYEGRIGSKATLWHVSLRLKRTLVIHEGSYFEHLQVFPSTFGNLLHFFLASSNSFPMHLESQGDL